MSNIVTLNQPFVSVGLTPATLTIPTTGLYNVQVQFQVPQALITGDGAGSGTGLGSGAGGGDPSGFNKGGNGLSVGGVGQGFGAVPNNYQQPPAYGSNQTSGPAIASALSIVVAQNGSTKYTSTAPSPTQSAQQFKVQLSCTAGDVILITPSSATASDNNLNGVQITYTIAQGL